MKNYGKILKEIRRDNDLTLKQIEKATGISNQNLSNWENGKTIPNIHHCEILADFYDISLDELIGREKEYKEKSENITQNNVFGNNIYNRNK